MNGEAKATAYTRKNADVFPELIQFLDPKSPSIEPIEFVRGSLETTQPKMGEDGVHLEQLASLLKGQTLTQTQGARKRHQLILKHINKKLRVQKKVPAGI